MRSTCCNENALNFPIQFRSGSSCIQTIHARKKREKCIRQNHQRRADAFIELNDIIKALFCGNGATSGARVVTNGAARSRVPWMGGRLKIGCGAGQPWAGAPQWP